MEVAPTQTVWQKYWALLSSPRFHQLVAIGVLQAVRHYGWLDDFMANLLTGLLAGSVGINTVDRFSQSPPPVAPGTEDV